MSIKLMQTPDGRTSYVFGIQLINSLMKLDADTREDLVATEACIWVSENEGYNSLDYDRMVEELADELSFQVLEALENQRVFQAKHPDRDFAHEADMAELRREQLEADGPWDDELVDDYED